MFLITIRYYTQFLLSGVFSTYLKWLLYYVGKYIMASIRAEIPAWRINQFEKLRS
jgi:hypothetical protein